MAISTAIERLRDNMADVDRLLEIHTELTGAERGRRRGVEVLNKSAVVLTTASWEAFVEDLAAEGFDFLLAQSATHDTIPSKVRALAAQVLLKEKNSDKLWALADEGWKSILQQHKQSSVEKFAGSLNTPRPDKVDDLFEALVGIRNVSSSWNWKRQSARNSRERLSHYITVRGQIAHQVATEKNINKAYVQGYANFVSRLAVETANQVREYINEQVSKYPWDKVDYEQL